MPQNYFDKTIYINSDSGNEQLQNTSGWYQRNNNSVSSGPNLLFGRGRGTAISDNTVVSANDILGGVYFAGNDGTDYNTTAAAVEGYAEATTGANRVPGLLEFKTSTDASPSVLTERMRIDSRGRAVIALGGHAAPTAGASNKNLFTIIGDTTSKETSASMNLWRDNAPNNPNLTLGQINFLGEQDTGVPGAAIAAQSEAAWNKSGNQNDHPGRLVFSTTGFQVRVAGFSREKRLLA